MNRVNQLFSSDKKKLLSVFFYAGCPTPESTSEIVRALGKNGVDMIQIGIPSVNIPPADTPILKDALQSALKNETTLKDIFEQLRHIRRTVETPLLLSGYLETILKFGFEPFCRKSVECGVDGVIIPDLPFDDYQKRFRIIAERYGLLINMVITPETSEERIREIDKHTSGFICMRMQTEEDEQKNAVHHKRDFFKKIKELKLNNSLMASFDVNNKVNFQMSCEYASGAVVDSYFAELLHEEKDAEQAVKKLILRLRK